MEGPLSGPAAVAQLLHGHQVPLTGPQQFGVWLQEKIACWSENDPLYASTARIRDIKRENREEVSHVESQLRQAERNWARCEERREIEELQRAVKTNRQAIDGLTSFLEGGGRNEQNMDTGAGASARKLEAARRKLDGFRKCQEAAQGELEVVTTKSPAYSALEEARRAREFLWATLGADGGGTLSALDGDLEQMKRRKGQAQGVAGKSFEAKAREAVEHLVVPALAREGQSRVVVLQSVTLGCAKAEIDYVVAEVSAGGSEGGSLEPVRVRALVEVKRNCNDLAYGWSRYQETISWLCDDALGYDSEDYVNKIWRTGRFGGEGGEQAYTHLDPDTGEEFRFTRSSFADFRRVPSSSSTSEGCDSRSAMPEHGVYAEGLYLVTRRARLQGLQGMPSAAQQRVSARVASDWELEIGDEEQLGALLEWARGMSGPWQSADVLSRVYGGNGEFEERARHILLI